MPNRIEGNLGFTMYRGKEIDSIENQIARELRKTTIHYNALSTFKELSQKYDYGVVSSGKDMEAKELGVWKEQGRIFIMVAIALGSLNKKLLTFILTQSMQVQDMQELVHSAQLKR